jgi:hypothetical protein
MNLTTLEIACLASICNHCGGFLLLGLHEVEYAGRPASPSKKKPGPLGILISATCQVAISTRNSAGLSPVRPGTLDSMYSGALGN